MQVEEAAGLDVEDAGRSEVRVHEQGRDAGHGLQEADERRAVERGEEPAGGGTEAVEIRAHVLVLAVVRVRRPFDGVERRPLVEHRVAHLLGEEVVDDDVRKGGVPPVLVGQSNTERDKLVGAEFEKYLFAYLRRGHPRSRIPPHPFRPRRAVRPVW